MLCWPRLASTTTVGTTLSLVQPAANTTGCAHWPSLTPVSIGLDFVRPLLLFGAEDQILNIEIGFYNVDVHIDMIKHEQNKLSVTNDSLRKHSDVICNSAST